MQTNKFDSSNTNYHLSMLADQTKLNHNTEKVSIEELNDTSDDNIKNSYSNDNSSNNNNNNIQNRFSESNSSSLNNVVNLNNNIKTENIDTENNKSNFNVDAKSFNLNPDNFEYNNLDERSKKFKKMEKLAKLIELKNRGFNLTKNYSLDSNYEEMCFEIEHWSNYQMKKDGVELGKSFLMNAVTAMEFLNDRYDPFSFKLNGWSEQVKVNSDNYNDVFGELYDKYKTSGKKIEPEIKLLLMLSASAVTFHASKSLADSLPIPGGMTNDIMNSINSKISSSMKDESNDETYNTKQQKLFEMMKKQQSDLKKNNSNKSTNNNSNNLNDILNNLKKTTNNVDDSSSVSISSSVTLGSEKKKNILKINTK
tara:strand:- start:1204 stop:2304 length:1101 start_codon:yes stop_codon:yes gene_type:complete